MSAAPGEALGGPAEQARRLVEALGDWASSRLGSAEEHIATGAAECLVCPVCQLIAALRGDRSEVLTRLNEAWAAFLGVLSTHPPRPTPEPDAGADTSEPRKPERRPVQNIDVR
jgi:hypothetical protein